MNLSSDVAAPHASSMRVGDAGRVRLTPDGRLEWRGPDGPVGAGDGVAAALLDVIASGGGEQLVASRGSAVVDPPGAPFPAEAGADERAIDVDQTHRSVIVGGHTVLKLVTEWGAADRSADLLARLTGTGIAPDYRGRVDWVMPDGARSTVALASAYLPEVADGWTWAVDDVLAALDGRDDDAVWPEAVAAAVARMHVVLADSAAVVTISAGEYRARARVALQAAEEAVENGGAVAARLASRRGALERSIATFDTDLRLAVFPVHGDLHVGQILRAPGADRSDPMAYSIIDFDGDPQATAEERVRPMPAALDLAHLLTSIDMVASVVQRRRGRADAAVAAWAEGAREAAASSYRRALADAGAESLIDGASALVACLEVEQLAREVTYASRFLPRWLYAPDGALFARFAPDRQDQDIPWTPPASPTTSA